MDNFRYLISENIRYATRSANAFQKLSLVVDELKGRIIIPNGHKEWIHDAYQDSVDSVRVPEFMLKKGLRKILQPLVTFLVFVRTRRSGFRWILPVSNETSLLAAVIMGIFGADLWLTTWDPPGVSVRDRSDAVARFRCFLMDRLLCFALKHSQGLILNLHPGFCEGRIPQRLMPRVHSFVNGTCVESCRELAKRARKVPARIGINSRVEKGKGCDELRDVILDVCAKNKEVTVVWIGVGDQYDRVVSEIRAAGLGEDRVMMPGSVNHSEALQWLATASLALNFYHDLPSLRWNYVLKAPEFLSLGVPIIMTNTPGAREYVKTGVNGVLIEDLTTSNISSLILRMLQDQTELSNMAKAASEGSLQYSWEKINSEIARVMRNAYAKNA